MCSYAAVTPSLAAQSISLKILRGSHKLVVPISSPDGGPCAEPEYVVQGDPEWAFMVNGYVNALTALFFCGPLAIFESPKPAPGYFAAACSTTFEPSFQGKPATSWSRQFGLHGHRQNDAFLGAGLL